MAKYNPEPYTPDGGVSVLGLPVLAAVMLVASLALGWLASVIAQSVWIILIFPFCLGVLLIIVGWITSHLTKMRNTVIAGLLGFITGSVTMLTMHYVDYSRFVRERDELLRDLPELPPNAKPEAQAAFAKLQAMRNITSFGRYMDWQAERGVTLTKSSINIGYVGSWIYWAIELLIVAVMTTFGLIAGAREPFCGTCNQWKEERLLGGLSSDPEVVDLVNAGDLDGLANYRPHPTFGPYQLKAHVCPTCGEEGTIAVKVCAVTKNKNGETSTNELVHRTYPGAALNDLEALFKPTNAVDAEPPEDEEDEEDE